MAITIHGKTPGREENRDLTLLKVNKSTDEVLVGIHKPSDPDGGWAVWIQRAELEALLLSATAMLK